jgi:hypothetical protein
VAIISSPVVFSSDSQKIIDNYESKPEMHKPEFWFDELISGIKSEAKYHYKIIQRYRCVYCTKKIPVDHSAVWDVEHIVARETAPHFMFIPRNLCVACKDCNGAKSNQNILVNKKRKTYPKSADAFLIVHPHFDDYENHIAIYLNNIYSPKSRKGQKTIEVCNLLRFSYEQVGWDSEIAKTPDILEIASELLSEPEEEHDKLLMEMLMKAQITISNTLVKRQA